MRRSTYKDILDFLQQFTPGAVSGQMSRRFYLVASLIQACIRNGHCRLESLSEPTDAYRAQKKSSLVQQAKRWLNSKWTDWQTFYLPFVRHFLQCLGGKGQIVFVMDGSQTSSANTTLMLSVLCRGFAIPVAWIIKKEERAFSGENAHRPAQLGRSGLSL